MAAFLSFTNTEHCWLIPDSLRSLICSCSKLISTMPSRRMEELMYSSINLDLGTRWKYPASRPCRYIPRERAHWYPLDGRVSGPRSRFRRYGIWRSGCIDPHFLDLDTRWRWVVKFTPQLLYPRRKFPRYPLDRRLGGTQSRFGRLEEEKNLTVPGLEPQPVASRYTNCAIPAPLGDMKKRKIFPFTGIIHQPTNP
jgi:hypothetical protein